ncbi:hypothetical protein HAX54_002828 [Datura stramonium]|uniref:At1g61320/AtMIF1 LRR domain-containing protein n=1 Tax=Datura stramonium TaxID=4076 RepID=A0ABS8T5Q7_DATST|nr:hypothetical protein [Datura stramonium]
MSIVSETWLRAWFTHPYLEFAIYSPQHMKGVDLILERYRDSKISIHMFKFLKGFDKYYDFDPLYDKWLAIALYNGVKHLEFAQAKMPSFSPYTFPIYNVLLSGAAKSLTELVLENCHLLSSLSTTTIKCHSLEKLTLYEVTLDDNMFHTLIISCPFIVNFKIEYCIGLTRIELRNLQKIKSVYIATKSDQRVSIQNTPTLEYLTYIGLPDHSSMLDIFKCPNVKYIKLVGETLSHRFLEHLISTSQFLESLILHHVLLLGSGRLFNICGSQSLKLLKISGCTAGSIGEIDVPNLATLEYFGRGDHIPKLKSFQLKHSSRLCLSCSSHNLNYGWFCKLREFLSKSTTSWSQVSLQFNGCGGTQLQQLHHPQLLHSTCPQVDDLDREIEDSTDCLAFMNALLWSCHPRKFRLHSTIEMITCFIDHLMSSPDDSCNSTCHWRSQLKQVKAYRYDWQRGFNSLTQMIGRWRQFKWKSEEITSREVAKANLWEGDYILFLLDWSCH